MGDIVIFGAGLIAETAYHYFTGDSQHRVAAFTVDGACIKTGELFGRPVVPFEEVLDNYPPDRFAMFVAVGYQELNRLRARKYAEAKALGYRLVSYVSSRVSNVGGVEVGDNCLILEHQTIQPCSRIGDDVTIWSGNHIGHHSIISDHCFITSHVVVSGNTAVEPYCFIGVNATIGHGIRIGADSIIGAGCMVTKDAPAGSVFIEPDTEPFRLKSRDFLRFSKL